MSSTTIEQLRHARNRRAFAYTYSRCEQMLASHTVAELRGYLRTWQTRLENAEFGTTEYAAALGATTYLLQRIHPSQCRRPRRTRRSAQRYTVRGSKW